MAAVVAGGEEYTFLADRVPFGRDYAFAGIDGAGVIVLDVSNPAAPVRVADIGCADTTPGLCTVRFD